MTSFLGLCLGPVPPGGVTLQGTGYMGLDSHILGSLALKVPICLSHACLFSLSRSQNIGCVHRVTRSQQ